MTIVEHIQDVEIKKFKQNEKNANLFIAVKPPRKLYKKERT